MVIPALSPSHTLNPLKVWQAGGLLDEFDYALWMDADNHLIADCCEDLLGTLVALRHGWSYSSGTTLMSATLLIACQPFEERALAPLHSSYLLFC